MTEETGQVRGILGKKLGMTRVFGDRWVGSVTAIEAGPCTVTQVKTSSQDGYSAVQLGFGPAKQRGPAEGAKPLKGARQFRHIRELRVDDDQSMVVGQKVDAGLFKEGELVDVTGISKGKGFAGVVKRYHFKGGKKTHGQSDRERAPGAIGANTSPGRVIKGMRMAGHMGDERVTVRHLKVVKADPERNLLLVRGAVPGARNGLLLIKKSGKG